MTVAKRNMAVSIAGTALVLSFAFAGAASALTVSCTGVAATSSITWTASSSGGISPIAFLWGNGSTSSVQTVSATPGTYSMTIRGTDASSTVATSTCSATVAASATTTPSVGTDIKAQIQALLAQIAALKAQIAQLITGQIGGGTGTTTPPVISPPGKACNTGIGRDIARGDFGDDIKDLQKFLAKHPNLYPEGIVNGFYGPHTMQAVRRWQKLHGIKPTGFFGKFSREVWRKHCDDDNDDQVASSTVSVSGSASTTLGAWIDQELANGKNGHGKGRGKGNDRNDD